MNKSAPDLHERLEHLEHVFASRRARLASSLAQEPVRPAGSRPLVKLQTHGYSVALMLALTAFLPTVLRLALKRRKMLFSAAATALKMRKWRSQLRDVQPVERRR